MDIFCRFITLIHINVIMLIIAVVYIYCCMFDVVLCTHWLVTGASMGDMMGHYSIHSVLPDKFARFLYEFHDFRFESLDLSPLPADRSDFYVHEALDPQVPYTLIPIVFLFCSFVFFMLF